MGLFPECHTKEQGISTTEKGYGAEGKESAETGNSSNVVKMQKKSAQ